MRGLPNREAGKNVPGFDSFLNCFQHGLSEGFGKWPSLFQNMAALAHVKLIATGRWSRLVAGREIEILF